jgi:hypothetical protein
MPLVTIILFAAAAVHLFDSDCKITYTLKNHASRTPHKSANERQCNLSVLLSDYGVP